jgi:hypothetical protein
VLDWVETFLHPAKHYQTSSLKAFEDYRRWSARHGQLPTPATYAFFLGVVAETYNTFPVWIEEDEISVFYFKGRLE